MFISVKESDPILRELIFRSMAKDNLVSKLHASTSRIEIFLRDPDEVATKKSPRWLQKMAPLPYPRTSARTIASTFNLTESKPGGCRFCGLELLPDVAH